MFHILFSLLFSSLVVHSQNFFECYQSNWTRRSVDFNNFPISCGDGEKYEVFWPTRVRTSDIKAVKVSVTDSYTGQKKQLSFPFKNAYIDSSYVNPDGYRKIKFMTDELARDHSLKGSVKFVSYELSPDIYVGYRGKRFKLSDLFNKHRKAVMKCSYSGAPDMIKVEGEVYCYGRGSCKIDNKNVPNMPFFCMSKNSRCPKATPCAIEDRAKKYTKNNW